MAYLSESELRRKAEGVVFRKLASYEKRATIFLSHSHKDREIAKGLIGVLAEQGISVYVDWNDSSMPRITSRATAEKIKERIGEMSLFALLATQNGLNSKWVPWETGVADQKKTASSIFVIPVEDRNGQYAGNEYLQLYQRLELDALGRARIVAPGEQVQEGKAAASFLGQHIVYG